MKRNPEATSATRAQAFNKPQVALCFNTYRDIVQSIDSNMLPDYLFELAEATSVSMQQDRVKSDSEEDIQRAENQYTLSAAPNMEKAKTKSAPPPIPKRNTRKLTKALHFSCDSDHENDSLHALSKAQDDEEDCPCIYCNDLYFRSNPKEVFLKCLNCKRWAHTSCADIPEKTERFTCELCM